MYRWFCDVKFVSHRQLIETNKENEKKKEFFDFVHAQFSSLFKWKIKTTKVKIHKKNITGESLDVTKRQTRCFFYLEKANHRVEKSSLVSSLKF